MRAAGAGRAAPEGEDAGDLAVAIREHLRPDGGRWRGFSGSEEDLVPKSLEAGGVAPGLDRRRAARCGWAARSARRNRRFEGGGQRDRASCATRGRVKVASAAQTAQARIGDLTVRNRPCNEVQWRQACGLTPTIRNNVTCWAQLRATEVLRP